MKESQSILGQHLGDSNKDPLKELKFEIQTFLRSNNKNQWLDGNHVQIYLRKAVHLFRETPDEEGKLIQCLDLANICVDAKFRKQGIGKQTVELLLQLNPYPLLLIECIHNTIFFNHLIKNHKTVIDFSNPISLFIKNNLIF